MHPLETMFACLLSLCTFKVHLQIQIGPASYPGHAFFPQLGKKSCEGRPGYEATTYRAQGMLHAITIPQTHCSLALQYLLYDWNSIPAQEMVSHWSHTNN